MKIALLNFSGNTGKSIVAKHLIAPQLSNAEFIAVESLNSDEGDRDVFEESSLAKSNSNFTHRLGRN